MWVEFGAYYESIDPVEFQTPAIDGLVEWLAERIETERSPDAVWLVAESGSRLIGYIRAQIWREHEAAAWQPLRTEGVVTLKVDGLMVAERERRSGIGDALMRAVEAWSVDRGATEAFVISYAHSPTSVPFYERRMGYEPKTTGYWKRLSELT